jgi:aryl-alcohol dehydrogenase-like predicted oxidoreductase
VSVVIPGASRPDQVRANVDAAGVSPLAAGLHEQLAAVYRAHVRDFIRGPY